MNIFTDGSNFSHAQSEAGGRRLTFELAAGASASGEHAWWGYLRAGDVLVTDARGADVELLDERLRPLARALGSRAFAIPRTGVHHLRVRAQGSDRTIALRIERPVTRVSIAPWLGVACTALALFLIVARLGR